MDCGGFSPRVRFVCKKTGGTPLFIFVSGGICNDVIRNVKGRTFEV